MHAAVPLETSQRVQRPFDDDTGLLRRLVQGWSTHTSHESASLAAEACGLSASSVSKRFKRCAAETLKPLQERALVGQDVVAVFIDAKRYAKDGILVG